MKSDRAARRSGLPCLISYRIGRGVVTGQMQNIQSNIFLKKYNLFVFSKILLNFAIADRLMRGPRLLGNVPSREPDSL